MKLRKLLEGIEILNDFDNFDFDIKGISYDSRQIEKDSIFVCLKGSNFDGHKFASEAMKNGAKVVVCERNLGLENQIIVKNTRKTLAKLSANFFENPSKFLNVIAITGTKGKTTTASFISDVLNYSGKKTVQIGTLGAIFEKDKFCTKNTTPESFEIQKLLKKALDLGFKNVVLEASSIGLKNHRLDDISINYGVFTNLSSDHIGINEHENMQDYIKSKSLLFKMCKMGIINIDDKMCNEVIDKHSCKIRTYGFNEPADLKCDKFQICKNEMGSNFVVDGHDFSISIPGKYNIYNALAAISVCKEMNIGYEKIKDCLKNCKIRGRSEVVFKNSSITILIDYAHNSFGLENILTSLREYNPKRIVTLFGAGGNRDRNRRFSMGRISGKLSDLSVITSDNSRYESTNDIIEDIKTGISETSGKYVVIPDRREAIEYCIKNSKKGDLILLAGKGHETYQEINGFSYHFDEKEIVNDILNEQKIV